MCDIFSNRTTIMAKILDNDKDNGNGNGNDKDNDGDNGKDGEEAYNGNWRLWNG